MQEYPSRTPPYYKAMFKIPSSLFTIVTVGHFDVPLEQDF